MRIASRTYTPRIGEGKAGSFRAPNPFMPCVSDRERQYANHRLFCNQSGSHQRS